VKPIPRTTRKIGMSSFFGDISVGNKIKEHKKELN
jgi:hypothetical protein